VRDLTFLHYPVGLHLGAKMPEVVWPSEILEARLDKSWLHFYGPDGERAAVPTEGPNKWNLELSKCGGYVRISPSIHNVGYWHSPNPVIFKLVKELKDPKS